MKPTGKYFLVGIMLSAIAAGYYQYQKYRIAPEIKFAALQLQNTKGEAVSLYPHRGSYTLVCFFGTWCASCLKEIPSLEKLVANHSAIKVYLISDEPIKKLAAVEQSHPALGVLQLQDPLSSLKIFTVPTAYLLDTTGRVTLKKVGANDWDKDSKLLRLTGALR